MTHRETKKEAKMQNKQSTKPPVIHNDEIKKKFPKGIIKGTDRV